MNLTTINRLRLGWRSFRLDSLDQMKNSMGNEIFLHVHVRLFLINRMNIPRNFFQNVICLHFTGLTKPKNLLNAVEWVQMTIISILNVDQYERDSRTEGETPFSKEVFYLISDWYDFRALRIGIIPLSELDMGSKSQKIPQNSLKIFDKWKYLKC